MSFTSVAASAGGTAIAAFLETNLRAKANHPHWEVTSGLDVSSQKQDKLSEALEQNLKECAADTGAECKTDPENTLKTVMQTQVLYEVMTIHPVGATLVDTAVFQAPNLGVVDLDTPSNHQAAVKVLIECDHACQTASAPTMKFINMFEKGTGRPPTTDTQRLSRFVTAMAVCRYHQKWWIFRPPLPSTKAFQTFAELETYLQVGAYRAHRARVET